MLPSRFEMKAYGIVFGLLGPCLAWPALAQNDTDLSAGGLAPPEAIESESDRAAREQQTEADLQKAEEEDSGRGLEFFWLNGEIGATQVWLKSDFVGSADKSQLGLTYGGGLGLRIVAFTVGARFRMASLPDTQLWTLNAEGGFRIPLGSIEPYFTLGAGYASMAGFDEPGFSDARGLNVRGGAGLDYYPTEVFSLGANLTGEFLYLARSEGDSDSSVAGAGTLTAVVGLHF